MTTWECAARNRSGRVVACSGLASGVRKRGAYLDGVYGNGQLGVFVVVGHFGLEAQLSVGWMRGEDTARKRTLLGRVRKWTAMGRPL
jgi:hypothetical protein